MLDIVKIRFKIPFYSRITVKSKAQLRDCFVMHLFLERVMHGVIAQLKQLGKVRTSETYTTTLNNFMAFRDEQDVPLDFLSLRLGALNEKKTAICQIKWPKSGSSENRHLARKIQLLDCPLCRLHTHLRQNPSSYTPKA
jgi:hypothetical protein